MLCLSGGLAQEVARTLQALGQETRLRLLVVLDDGEEHTVESLARAVDVSEPNASRHLGILRDAGVVAVRPEGRCRYYSVADTEALRVIERYAAWRKRERRGGSQAGS
jgi:ArsR family transcriptional regulator, lead/cadmium/zinc/bismuth-responsive transcriptional repressor